MGALRKEQEQPAEGSWRSPHDPPGSFFRAEQTHQLYGRWPKPDVKEEVKNCRKIESAPTVSPKSLNTVESESSHFTAQLVTKEYKPEKHDALLVVVMVGQGIEWLQDPANRTEYSDDELRVYFERILKGARELSGSPRSPSLVDRLMMKILGDYSGR